MGVSRGDRTLLTYPSTYLQGVLGWRYGVFIMDFRLERKDTLALFMSYFNDYVDFSAGGADLGCYRGVGGEVAENENENENQNEKERESVLYIRWF
jgi:hypothetical protein